MIQGAFTAGNGVKISTGLKGDGHSRAGLKPEFSQTDHGGSVKTPIKYLKAPSAHQGRWIQHSQGSVKTKDLSGCRVFTACSLCTRVVSIAEGRSPGGEDGHNEKGYSVL